MRTRTTVARAIACIALALAEPKVKPGVNIIMSQLDKDVAYYVLAYLARQGYSHTMSSFLQECTVLPSNTSMMILPETPLSTIVAEHKARTESGLLLGKLGAQASWDALWEKLQHYLSQLRILADSLLESHHPAPMKSTERRRQYRTKKQFMSSTVTTASTIPQHHGHSVSTTSAAAGSYSCTAPLLPASSSPRKKKDPIRMQPLSDMPTASTTSSHDQLAPQQLLDLLLEDASLQHHLADLINSSLLSDDGTAGLTDRALDNIIAMTSQDSTASSVAQPEHSTHNNSCTFTTHNTQQYTDDGDK